MAPEASGSSGHELKRPLLCLFPGSAAKGQDPAECSSLPCGNAANEVHPWQIIRTMVANVPDRPCRRSNPGACGMAGAGRSLGVPRISSAA